MRMGQARQPESANRACRGPPEAFWLARPRAPDIPGNGPLLAQIETSGALSAVGGRPLAAGGGIRHQQLLRQSGYREYRIVAKDSIIGLWRPRVYFRS